MDSNIRGVEVIQDSRTYIEEVLKIKTSIKDPKTKLELLDILIKDYFRRKYHVKKNEGYSDMINMFLEKRKPHLATFCHDMVSDLYSGDEIDESRIDLILESAKLMLTRDMTGKIIDPDEISVKEIVNPFSALKNPQTSKDKILSKGARKLIESYLKEENEDKREEDKERSPEEDIEYLKKKLSMNQKIYDEEKIYSEIDDPEKIENIDDFERLKDRIKKRKAENINYG